MNTSELDQLAEAAIAAFYADCNIPESEQYEDDCALLSGSDETVMQWVQRCEENGESVPNFRAAVITYLNARHALIEGY